MTSKESLEILLVDFTRNTNTFNDFNFFGTPREPWMLFKN